MLRGGERSVLVQCFLARRAARAGDAALGEVRCRARGLQVSVGVRADFAVQADLFEFRSCPLHASCLLPEDYEVNVATTAVQLALELRLKVPVYAPVTATTIASFAAGDVPVSCCKRTNPLPTVAVPV